MAKISRYFKNFTLDNISVLLQGQFVCKMLTWSEGFLYLLHSSSVLHHILRMWHHVDTMGSWKEKEQAWHGVYFASTGELLMLATVVEDTSDGLKFIWEAVL